MERARRRIVDVNPVELDAIMDGALEKPMSESGHQTLKQAVHAMIDRLTPRTSEKTADVIESEEEKPASESPKTPKPGHGRRGAADFASATKIPVEIPDLWNGQRCPCCNKGKLTRRPIKPLIRIRARSPVEVSIYELESLRCNLCGKITNAEPPAEVGPEKYDDSVIALVGLARYGSGFPMKRFEGFLRQFGVDLSDSVQWELVEDGACWLMPIYKQLLWWAAQAPLLHNDDTRMRVLQVKRPEGSTRTGVFTTGVVAVGENERKIACFFTGIQHSGENMGELLQKRLAELAAPVQMCDALSHNRPKRLSENIEVLVAHCWAHGRRNFVEAAESFPSDCRHVLEQIGIVYQVDEQARREGMLPAQRLELHQTKSQPVLDALHEWMETKLTNKTVEPNSRLGQSLRYLRNHWHKLTMFLRQPGIPLDNNICERAIKKAVLHRKSSLFYRTENGADVGDLYMTLIHTCELNGIDAFAYLTEALSHPVEVARSPAAWLPWTYRATLTELTSSTPDG